MQHTFPFTEKSIPAIEQWLKDIEDEENTIRERFQKFKETLEVALEKLREASKEER